jgi:hypothetical protein
MDQVLIAVFGAVAVFLTQARSSKAQRWACILGMASQPAWFYAAITAEQWGIVVLNCLYTLAWGKGIWTHWLAPKRVSP